MVAGHGRGVLLEEFCRRRVFGSVTSNARGLITMCAELPT